MPYKQKLKQFGYAYQLPNYLREKEIDMKIQTYILEDFFLGGFNESLRPYLLYSGTRIVMSKLFSTDLIFCFLSFF